MVSATKDALTFNDLMATPIDFYKYVLNRIKIDNLTQDLLLRPAYDLLKGTCTSTIKFEYNFQECFSALTDKLDWNNPKGDRYPHRSVHHLPLQGHPSHLTIVTDYFFNNDLEYLKSSNPERMYTTLIMKTKATRYEIIIIEDMVPTLWSIIKHAYDKDAAKRIKHWGERRKLCVKKLHGYGHLKEVVVKRANRHLCKFKECDFLDLHFNDIKDILLLAVQHDHSISMKVILLTLLWLFTFPKIKFKELYTPSYKPSGVIYEDLNKQKRVMRTGELYKFLDGTLKKVQDEIHHKVLDFHLGYNKEMSMEKWVAIDRKRSELMVELIDKQVGERRIIRNLERLVGGRELKMDYKLMTLTV
nr:hypothetical protein [Tanacetum cinerariifolium]